MNEKQPSQQQQKQQQQQQKQSSGQSGMSLMFAATKETDPFVSASNEANDLEKTREVSSVSRTSPITPVSATRTASSSAAAPAASAPAIDPPCASIRATTALQSAYSFSSSPAHSSSHLELIDGPGILTNQSGHSGGGMLTGATAGNNHTNLHESSFDDANSSSNALFMSEPSVSEDGENSSSAYYYYYQHPSLTTGASSFSQQRQQRIQQGLPSTSSSPRLYTVAAPVHLYRLHVDAAYARYQRQTRRDWARRHHPQAASDGDDDDDDDEDDDEEEEEEEDENNPGNRIKVERQHRNINNEDNDDDDDDEEQLQGGDNDQEEDDDDDDPRLDAMISPSAPARALPSPVPSSPGNTSLSSWESPSLRKTVLVQFIPPERPTNLLQYYQQHLFNNNPTTGAVHPQPPGRVGLSSSATSSPIMNSAHRRPSASDPILTKNQPGTREGQAQKSHSDGATSPPPPPPPPPPPSLPPPIPPPSALQQGQSASEEDSDRKELNGRHHHQHHRQRIRHNTDSSGEEPVAYANDKANWGGGVHRNGGQFLATLDDRYARQDDPFLRNLRLQSGGFFKQSSPPEIVVGGGGGGGKREGDPQRHCRAYGHTDVQNEVGNSSWNVACRQESDMVSSLPDDSKCHMDESIAMTLSDSERDDQDTGALLSYDDDGGPVDNQYDEIVPEASDQPLDWEVHHSADDEKTTEVPLRVRKGSKQQQQQQQRQLQISQFQKEKQQILPTLQQSINTTHQQQQQLHQTTLNKSHSQQPNPRRHRRKRSGDLAAASLATGGPNWKGMEDDNIPMPPPVDTTEDGDDDDGCDDDENGSYGRQEHVALTGTKKKYEKQEPGESASQEAARAAFRSKLASRSSAPSKPRGDQFPRKERAWLQKVEPTRVNLAQTEEKAPMLPRNETAKLQNSRQLGYGSTYTGQEGADGITSAGSASFDSKKPEEGQNAYQNISTLRQTWNIGGWYGYPGSHEQSSWNQKAAQKSTLQESPPLPPSLKLTPPNPPSNNSPPFPQGQKSPPLHPSTRSPLLPLPPPTPTPSAVFESPLLSPSVDPGNARALGMPEGIAPAYGYSLSSDMGSNPLRSLPEQSCEEVEEEESQFDDSESETGDSTDPERTRFVQNNRLKGGTSEYSFDLNEEENRFEDPKFRGTFQRVLRPHPATQSPFANIGKKSVEKAPRSTFLPQSSILEDDNKAYSFYICPRCGSRQREFFTVVDAPRQLEGPSSYLALYFAIYVVASLFIFGLEEGWLPLDCIYFAVITLTTAGLGDFVPTTDANKIVCSIFIYFGVACIGLLLGSYIASMMDDKAYRDRKTKQIDSCPNCARLQTLREAASKKSQGRQHRPSVPPPSISGMRAASPAIFMTQPRVASDFDRKAVLESNQRHHRHHSSQAQAQATQQPQHFPPPTKPQHRRGPSQKSNSSHGSSSSGVGNNTAAFVPTTPTTSEHKLSNDKLIPPRTPVSDSSRSSRVLPVNASTPMSASPNSYLLGSPVTRNILGRQSHTRHYSIDITDPNLSKPITSGGQTPVRKFSADLTPSHATPFAAVASSASKPEQVTSEKQSESESDSESTSSGDDDDSWSSSSSSPCTSSASTIEEIIDERKLKLKAVKYVFLTLRQALLNSLVIIAVGCLGFWLIEGFSLIDSWYFTTVLLTTVGYGDIVPVTKGGKLFATIYILVAGSILLNNMSLISTIPIELRKRRIERAVLTQFGDQLDDAALTELATGPVIQRLHLSATGPGGLHECTREMFSLAMLVRLGKVTENDIRETFAAFRRLDINNEGVLNSKSIIAAMIQKRKAECSASRSAHAQKGPVLFPREEMIPPQTPLYWVGAGGSLHEAPVTVSDIRFDDPEEAMAIYRSRRSSWRQDPTHNHAMQRHGSQESPF